MSNKNKPWSAIWLVIHDEEPEMILNDAGDHVRDEYPTIMEAHAAGTEVCWVDDPTGFMARERYVHESLVNSQIALIERLEGDLVKCQRHMEALEKQNQQLKGIADEGINAGKEWVLDKILRHEDADEELLDDCRKPSQQDPCGEYFCNWDESEIRRWLDLDKTKSPITEMLAQYVDLYWDSCDLEQKIEGLEKQLSALTTPRPMSEAPRDGTEFLARARITGKWFIVRRDSHTQGLVSESGVRFGPFSFDGWLPFPEGGTET